MSERPSHPSPRATAARRRLWLLVGLIVLLVQTALPAHQDTHPLGSNDSHCEYCVLAGHAFGVPGVAISVPSAPVYTWNRGTKPAELHVRPFTRTRFSRGPPLDPIV